MWMHLGMLTMWHLSHGIGCHVGPVYVDAFGYADDVALVAPSLYSSKS